MDIHCTILTSSDIEKFERCYLSARDQFDITVVINTLDPVYESTCMEYCQENSIDYIVTDSNGTPARGKNSMVQHLLKNGTSDYYLMLDGDDYISDHAGMILQALCASAPNVILYKDKDIVSTVNEMIPNYIMDPKPEIVRNSYNRAINMIYRKGLLRRIVACDKKGLENLVYNEDLPIFEDCDAVNTLIKSDIHCVKTNGSWYNYEPTTKGATVSYVANTASEDAMAFLARFNKRVRGRRL